MRVHSPFNLRTMIALGALADIRRRGGVAAGIAVVAILAISGVASAGGHLQPSSTDVQPVLWFADGSPTEGASVLTRTPGMVLATVEAAGLPPGDAYTLWWVVFNAPENCSDGVCGEDDILNEDGTLNEEGIIAAQIGLGNATGNVTRDDGTTELGGRLKVDDDSGAHEVLFPAGFTGAGVLTASGLDAEVHLVVQSHGQARSGPPLSEQLSSFQAGCTPVCEDVQFAVHLP